MRVLRTILLLTGIAVLMPSPPENEIPVTAAETAGLVSAASQTVSDVATFCGRQPGVCRSAGYVAGRLEAKARYGVRLLYEWANEANSGPRVSPYADQADAADPIETGTTQAAGAMSHPSRSTLTIEDLLPEWRDSAGMKKG